MFIVIGCMALIGVLLFIVTSGANNFRTTSNLVYFQACERNLQSSGLAWARLKIQETKETIPHEM